MKKYPFCYIENNNFFLQLSPYLNFNTTGQILNKSSEFDYFILTKKLCDLEHLIHDRYQGHFKLFKQYLLQTNQYDFSLNEITHYFFEKRGILNYMKHGSFFLNTEEIIENLIHYPDLFVSTNEPKKIDLYIDSNLIKKYLDFIPLKFNSKRVEISKEVLENIFIKISKKLDKFYNYLNSDEVKNNFFSSNDHANAIIEYCKIINKIENDFSNEEFNQNIKDNFFAIEILLIFLNTSNLTHFIENLILNHQELFDDFILILKDIQNLDSFIHKEWLEISDSLNFSICFSDNFFEELKELISELEIYFERNKLYFI